MSSRRFAGSRASSTRPTLPREGACDLRVSVPGDAALGMEEPTLKRQRQPPLPESQHRRLFLEVPKPLIPAKPAADPTPFETGSSDVGGPEGESVFAAQCRQQRPQRALRRRRTMSGVVALPGRTILATTMVKEAACNDH